MKNEFTIVCRGSLLSLAQGEIVKKKLAVHFPGIQVKVLVKETAGDKNQSTPLHLVEGKDFFTKEIQEALNNGEADFAVHSMKDVSSEDFFDNTAFAIIDREALNDVAVFNSSVLNKIKNGEKIILGTSSPRRSNMAVAFLEKGLPKPGEFAINIAAEPVRGNVDTRLKKLDDGQYDGLILAAAGLNRLLEYQDSKEKLTSLLAGKKIMVLPLFECPPAAGQGAIVVETGKANADALILLNAIKDDKLTSAVEAERKIAHTHGYGCSQQFGVFHLDLPAVSFTYAAGTGQDDFFTEWNFQLPEWMEGKQLFSSARHMKDFFDYDYNEQSFNDIDTDACFVSSHRAVKPEAVKEYMVNRRIWAAGTRTWFQLAQQGTWVEGCADGLGLEWSLSLLQSPLVNLNRQDITILTSHHSRAMWETAGWHTQGVYELNPVFNQAVADEVAAAEILFWTNFQQYEIYKDFVSDNARHCCPCGKTASLFLKAGIQPVVFPTIKAFTQWEKKHTSVTNAG